MIVWMVHITVQLKSSDEGPLMNNHTYTENCQLHAGCSVDGFSVDCILFSSEPNGHFPT